MSDTIEKFLDKMWFRLLFPEFSWKIRIELWEKRTLEIKNEQLENENKELKRECGILTQYIKQVDIGGEL